MDIKELKKLINSGKKNIKEIAEAKEISYGSVSKSAQVATYKDLTTADDKVLKKICDAITKLKK